MKKFLPLILASLVILINPFDIFAASMEVSKSSTFSSSDLNFSGGEMVYVKVKSEELPTHVLNVKDNNYSTVKSINLNRSGDGYTGSFAAPNNEGYYSLEARIEGSGHNVTSVKTIKVGSPNGANIKVNVNTSLKGTSTNSTNKEESKVEVKNSTDQKSEEKEKDTGEEKPGESPEQFVKDDSHEIQSGNWVFSTIKGLFSLLWPF